MAQLNVAMGRAEITPSIGTPLGGYLGRRRFGAAGVHDPLYAKVLGLETDDGPLLLYSLDLLGLTADRTRELAAAVSRGTGVPPERVVIACTHTHCGPSTLPLRGIPMAGEGYFDYLQAQTVAAGRMALERLRPATMLVGTAASSVGVNRRAGEPGAVRLGENPTGPHDEVLLAVRFLDAGSEETLGVVAAYGCHPTALGAGTLVSAEWAGLAMAALERRLGCECMFLNGPFGDVNPRGRDSTWARMGEIAATFEDDCLKALASAQMEPASPVGLAHLSVDLLMAPLAPEADISAMLLEAERALAQPADEAGRRAAGVRRAYALAVQKCREEGAAQASQAAELTGLRIGPVLLVGMPGEVFSEYSIRLREQAPFRYTMALSNVGAEVGYLPTREAFSEGGYEPTSFMYFGVQGYSEALEDTLFAGAHLLVDRLSRL